MQAQRKKIKFMLVAAFFVIAAAMPPGLFNSGTAVFQKPVLTQYNVSLFRNGASSDTTDTLAWVQNGDEVALFLKLEKDSTNWLDVFGGDSLNLGLEIELYSGPTGGEVDTASSIGYWQHGSSSAASILSITTADTSHPFWYYLFADSLEQAMFQRMIVRAGANHKRLNTAGVKLTATYEVKRF